MFSRRRSHKKAVPLNPPPSTTAAGTTAAQLAFFNTSTSSNAAPLSSAAAAAALRSATTSPEPVGSIQTKRMQRRLSNSSIGSGNDRPALARRGSNGSMTERTFRTPSPAQRNIASPDPDAPPVPYLPQNAGRPASSLDSTQRITSPTPMNGRRSASADEAAAIPAPSSRKNKRLSNVNEADELERAHNDFTRNFSRRDMSPPVSPPTSPMATGSSRTPSIQQNGQATGSAEKQYTPGTGAWFERPAGAAAPSTRTSSMSSLTLTPRTQPYQGTRPVSAAGNHYPGRASYDSQRSYSMTSDTTYNRNETVYDPNSRRMVPKIPVQPQMQPALQAARRAKSMETVYDPNSRTFVPKTEAARYDAPPSSTQSSPVIAPKKQRSMPAMEPKPPARTSGRYSSFTVQPREPASSPRALRKQPSAVREDTEAERRAEVKSLPLGQPAEQPRATKPAALPAKTYAPPPAASERSASLDVPRTSFDATSRGRNTSQSPQRSAHFSPSPILKPEMHAPPPRDLSPAKSAMKQSPASSVGTASPIATYTLPPIPSVAGPPSETSEAPSMDGIPGKKKKSVRVSFDEQPQELQSATTPTLPRTLRDRSPETSDDMDDDGMMRPRPALPSFGSVRRDRVQPAIAEKVTEMPPERRDVSSDHAIGGILRNSMEPLPPEVTSKESAGYVSDESSEADHPVSAPSNAAVQSRGVDKQDVPLTQTGQPMIRDFAATSSADSADLQMDSNDVPAIALMPPTPKPDDEGKEFVGPSETEASDETRGRNSMEGISIPGGWKDDVERTPTPTAPAVAVSAPSIDSAQSTSVEDSAATSTAAPIELTHSPQPLSDIDEDTDDSAAFSDAVEDPSDLEDEGGFASLDAIVESPLPSPIGASESRSIPLPLGQGEITDSPTAKQAPKTPEVFTGSVPALIQAANLGGAMDSSPPASPSAATANWDETTKYWSQLSKEKREAIEREALSSDDEPKLPAVAAPKRMKPRRFSSDEVPTMAATRQRQQDPAPPTLKKTMRASSGPVAAPSSQGDERVQMRSSMRTADTRVRPSSRDGPPSASPVGSGALQKRSMRPGSSGGPPTRPQTLISRDSDDSIYSQPGMPPPKKTAPRPKAEPPKVSARLQKELAKADDSDSESSFKKRRTRTSNVESGGRYSMRRSMRTGSIDETTAPVPVPEQRRPETPQSERSSKFGFRSLSPTFGRNKASTKEPPQEPAMRTTLRGSQSKAISAVGGEKESGMKSSLRASQPTTISKASKKSAPAPPSRLKSRFVDSDDEDENTPRRTFFKSRFADSDEDSEPGSPRLAPVRGIPRRKGQEDGDSTDLEEEEQDDNPAEAASKRFTALIGPHPGETDKLMAAARKNLGLNDDSASTQQHDVKEGEALSKGSLRNKAADGASPSTARAKDVEIIPPDKKKRGFMNSILRRNRHSSSSVPKVTPTSLVQTPASPVIAPTSLETPQAERPTLPSSPPMSASKVPQVERPSSPAGMPSGKLIRRESYQMWLQRANSQELLSSAAPASPGPTTPLAPTKETNPYTIDLDSSPPSSPPNPTQTPPSAADRPATSDGFSPEAIKLARTMRPDLNRNSQSGPLTPRRVQIQAGEEGSEPGEREPRNAIYSQKTGKKKKFGMLRKAFKLKD